MSVLPINIDCGENYGRYRLFDESAISKMAGLANVACGFHGGDYASIIGTLKMLKASDIKVGAHPSFPDLQGFGRRYIDMDFEDLVTCLFYQIASLKGLCEAMGIALNHVKAHGALYNACCKNEKEAKAMIQAVKKVSSDLMVLTQPNSVMEKMAAAENLNVLRESFADRAYQSDLSLVSRLEPGAVLMDPEQVKKQYEDLCNGQIVDVQGNPHVLLSDTVCIHGDHPRLGEIAVLLG